MADNQTKIVLNGMYKYQKNNNITKQCITNSMYLRDTLIANGIHSKVNAVMAVWANNDNELYNCVHMVVEYNDFVLDPSYEIHIKDACYYDQIKLVMEMYKDNNLKLSEEQIKELITKHIKMIKTAERINKGECLVVDKDYYHSQADDVEKYVKKYFKKNQKIDFRF